MGFTWVQDISVGASIDSVDIQEMRTNIDWIDDNYCTSANVSYCGTHNADEKTTINTSALTGEDGTIYGSNYPADDSTYNSGYDGTYNFGVDTSNYPSDLGANQSTVDATDYNINNTFCGGALGSQDSGYDSTYRSTYQSGYCPSAHTDEVGTYQGSNLSSGGCSTYYYSVA